MDIKYCSELLKCLNFHCFYFKHDKKEEISSFNHLIVLHTNSSDILAYL